MTKGIMKYLPKSKDKWKQYIVITIPVIFGSILYSLNGFVDNFMVGTVPGGAGALSAANTWTALILGINTGVSYTGAIFIAQYFNKGEFEKARQMQRIRLNCTLFFAIIFAALAWTIPEHLISLIAGSEPSGPNTSAQDIAAYNDIINQGIKYIRIIAFTWILMAIAMISSISLAETGNGKYTFYTSLAGLLMNILGNSILIYVFNMGVLGAAYASLGARLTTFVIYQIIMIIIKFEIFINPLTLFKIKKNIIKQFFRRSSLLIFTSIFYFYIQARMPLFSRGYPPGSIDNSPVGAINVLALTFAVMSIYLTAFSAVEANAANFVGKELGRNNIDQAKINSNELKGFNTLVAASLSIVMFGMSFIIPYMTFLAQNEVYKEVILKNVKYTLWTVCLFYPWWVWFVSSRINSMSGGKVFAQTMVNFIYGFVQVIYLVFVIYVIVPATDMSLPMAFFIFFLSDILYGILTEIVYIKVDWAKDVTLEYAEMEIEVTHTPHVVDGTTIGSHTGANKSDLSK